VRKSDGLHADPVDHIPSLVGFSTEKLYRRAALEYISLWKLIGFDPPSLEEAILEIQSRFSDKETCERNTVLPKETRQDQASLRLGSVLLFKP
jgi:hypothetical protein